MINRLKDNVFKNVLFTNNDRLILALSGGVDSVSLFHLLRLSGFKFEAAHVNYGLRGEESNEDEAFVEGLCKQYNIVYHIKNVATDYWEEKAINIQNEARNIRYQFFNQLTENPNDKILIAHNQDDNIETVLMNFTRGTGISGIAGLSPMNKNIIRPILFLTRKELEMFLIENKFKWREDKSNASHNYKRNRFRHLIVPEMKKENPAFTLAFDRYLANIKPVKNYFLKGLKAFKKQYLSTEKDGFKLSWDEIEELELFIFDVLKDFGFNQDQVRDIKNSISFSGKYFESNTHRLTIDRNCILIRDLIDINQSQSKSVEILESTKLISKPIKLECSISENTNILKRESIGQFDYNKLKFPLIVRKWNPGDKMKPLGLRGEKKISDILIDSKIPLPDKSNVYVLESEGEIVWLIGFVIGENYKVKNETQSVWSGILLD